MSSLAASVQFALTSNTCTVQCDPRSPPQHVRFASPVDKVWGVGIKVQPEPEVWSGLNAKSGIVALAKTPLRLDLTLLVSCC